MDEIVEPSILLRWALDISIEGMLVDSLFDLFSGDAIVRVLCSLLQLIPLISFHTKKDARGWKTWASDLGKPLCASLLKWSLICQVEAEDEAAYFLVSPAIDKRSQIFIPWNIPDIEL